jgi:hypothetical protein
MKSLLFCDAVVTPEITAPCPLATAAGRRPLSASFDVRRRLPCPIH